MPNITVNNASFYYELHGEGQPLIFIAGYGANGRSWMPIVDALSQHFQVITFDNRAGGQTTDDGVTLSVELMAQDVMALSDALNLKKPHIVGRSMGGTIVQSIAANYPDKIGKIGILVSSAKWRKATLMTINALIKMSEKNVDPEICNEIELAWGFGNQFLLDDKFSEILKQAAKNNPYSQSVSDQKRQFKVLEKFDGTKELNKIKAPTFIAYGTEDLLALPQESKFLASKIPHAKLVAFECGHIIVMEQTEKLAKELINFLL